MRCFRHASLGLLGLLLVSCATARTDRPPPIARHQAEEAGPRWLNVKCHRDADCRASGAQCSVEGVCEMPASRTREDAPVLITPAAYSYRVF
jgi:hypothetical protein